MNVGILGGGQLGRMLALAGYPLGLRFRVFDPLADACAGRVAPLTVGSYHDEHLIERFVDGLDVVTYEFENVPAAAAAFLAPRVALVPAPRALEVAQDRLAEKTEFQRLGIPTAPFAAVDSAGELQDALAELGTPAVLKTRRLGYDGKGQSVIRSPDGAPAAWRELGGAPAILEAFVEFQRELSILAVRSANRETAFYPLVENRHQAGILRLSAAPAQRITPELQALAESYALRLMEALGYVGLLTIELFQRDGELLANEFAPRVHNSGHWSIEGAETSQFENHLRAVTGLPLGSTAARAQSVMLNLIGSIPAVGDVLAIPHAHLHLYDKAPAPGRKLGHVTVCAPDPDVVSTGAEALGRLICG